MSEVYRSRVYTDRPAYADFDSPQRPFEPNVVNAAWNIFGKSYLYRQQYNQYKARKMNPQLNFSDLEDTQNGF